MRELTDYVLAIRVPGAPPAPEGVGSVVLPEVAAGDPISATVGGLRASGLTAADFRSLVIFLAPQGSAAVIPYAALCGFAGRRIDAYADGAVMEFAGLERSAGVVENAGRPPGHLMWAQVGGSAVDGLPTVHLGTGTGDRLVSPAAASVVRYAARLRLVPPASARAALAAFVLVATLRRRTEERFPFLSTGSEPLPARKDDPDQGIDLERLRREAARYRQELRAGHADAEIVPRVAVAPRDLRIARADATDIREVLRRLGSSCGERGLWLCPRPGNHRDGGQDALMRVSGGNRARCPRCDVEKAGPIRLVVDVLGLSPDEAATFILDSARVVGTRGPR